MDLVIPGIHSHEDGPQDQAGGHQSNAHDRRAGGLCQGIDMAGILDDQPRREDQGEGGTQPGDGKLQAHGEGHRTVLEPLGDRPGHGRPGDFTAETEQHTAHIGQPQGLRGFISARDGMEHEQGAAGHHADEDGARDPYPPLVQQDAADHQPAEHTQHAVPARIEAVAGSIPAQRRQRRILEQVGNAREHVVEKIRREHRNNKTSQREPAR